MLELPEDWNDYVLLDAGGGEKLEIWGQVKVIRPDPQAFWPKSYEWEKPDMHYHRNKSGGGKWEKHNKHVPDSWAINYQNLKFHVRPTGFKHMGLFPEQAVNWNKYKNFNLNKAKVLNLFAYTGGATLACLSAGAEVTHVDAAKSMNAWAKDNITLSGLSKTPHRVLTDDCLKFAQREKRRGNLYDAIIMDPPVYGRGPGGQMWKLEDNIYGLVYECMGLLSQNPLFVQINAYTAGFSPYVFANILQQTAKKHRMDGVISCGEIGILAKSGALLPCGMYALWKNTKPKHGRAQEIKYMNND